MSQRSSDRRGTLRSRIERAERVLAPALDRLPGAWRTRAALVLAVVGAAALALFVSIADGAIENDDLSALDPAVTGWAVRSRETVLTSGAWFFTDLGGTVGLIVLTLVAAAGLTIGHRRVHAVTLLLTMAGSSVTTVLLKLAFGRQRPSTDLLLGAPSATYSFPSGHSFNTAVFMGTLAGFVVLSGTTRGRKTAAVLVAVPSRCSWGCPASTWRTTG
ncbi:phosphatase PAP2 family protein [Actinomyces radicidentis]|uniref:phosphatase PAP2 family protein n=1 Tax=Actinomyces radicidentis TaxID=111015 RepID=UPI000B27E4C0|nr:phosphatase PAP2 family protein [Actinomyces radicidentis]